MRAIDVVPAELSLVQRYSDLDGRVGGISESVRGMRFNALLADALRRDGIDADADQRGPHGEVDVAFFHDGTWYLLEAKWYADPITDRPLRHLRDILTERRPGTIGILASRSGFTDSARRRAATARDVILLDRPHLEALIAGVTSGPELISAANRSISVVGHPETSLTTLLRPRRLDAEPIQIGSPDGFTSAAVAAPDGRDAIIVAHGHTITGITAHRDRLLVTVDDGVMEIDPRHRSKPRLRLAMTACADNPLVDPQGNLVVVRNGGVLSTTGNDLAVVAGGFDRAPLLVCGPGGAPWLLDRDTPGWAGNEHATLVEIGAEFGATQRWPAGLPAGACRAACSLRDRTFFVLGEGHSAVIDIDTGTYRWIITPVGRPHGLIRLDEHRVLIFGTNRHLQTAVVDTATDQSSTPTAVNLTGPVHGATRIGDAAFVVAGVPIDHATIVPVIARLDLVHLLPQA